jgi:nucleotide-binding universal stress UspA family protein
LAGSDCWDSGERRLSPAKIIADEATSAHCDLIVMGTHGRRGVSRVLLGSDAALVLQHSPVPVLLVRDVETEL